MKNKFTIAEGEVQRILGLHKQAILKENKIILSEAYGLNLINATNGAPEKWNLKSFKVSKKNGDILTATVVDSDNSKFTNIEINCKTKNILTIKSDGTGSFGHQHNGTTYRLGNDLVAIITESCSGTNKSNEGSSNLDGNKNTLYKNINYKTKKEQRFAKENDVADTIVINPGVTFYKNGTDQAIAFNVPIKVKAKGGGIEAKASSTQNITYYCAKGKYKFSGKNKGVLYYSKTGISSVLVKNICEKKGVLPDEKEVNGTSEYKSKKDTKDKPNNNPNVNPNVNPKVKGNRYTFDFDAIMKAINDTGKCAGSWGSSDGTNGTSGTQGTSGTNVIQNPLPINNKISADLYYKIIAN